MIPRRKLRNLFLNFFDISVLEEVVFGKIRHDIALLCISFLSAEL